MTSKFAFLTSSPRWTDDAGTGDIIYENHDYTQMPQDGKKKKKKNLYGTQMLTEKVTSKPKTATFSDNSKETIHS